jgi:two-component system phosphate regulon response regulator PhoB
MASPSERILVVSADPETRARVRESLHNLPLVVQETARGAEALELTASGAPALVIIDMLLDDLTGLALCRALREQPSLERVPVLMLSAFVHEMDRILAFETGVDDFVAKPFYKRELASRVGAILRRSRTRARRASPGPDTRERPLHLDAERGRLEVHGRPADLTPKEFEILAVLLRHEGRVLSRERIVGEVWGGRAADPRVVDAHVKSIRRKLGDAAGALQTIRGIGFRLSAREAGAMSSSPKEARDDPEAA